MKQTIAQQIKWDFETNGDLDIRDKNGRPIYFEDSAGDWEKWEFDSQGHRIYFETSNGIIKDNRPKHCEGKIVEFEGEKFKLVKV